MIDRNKRLLAQAAADYRAEIEKHHAAMKADSRGKDAGLYVKNLTTMHGAAVIGIFLDGRGTSITLHRDAVATVAKGLLEILGEGGGS